MTLNSFLSLWVGFMGTLVHQCPLCPLRTLGLVKHAGDHGHATMGTCVHVHVQDIVWVYVSGVSCVHFALSVTLSCPRSGIVGRIPLAPFGADRLLGNGVAAHAILTSSIGSDFSVPLAKCVCLAHCPRGELVEPHCAVPYISPMSKDGKCLLLLIGHLCLIFGEMSFKLRPIKNRFAFLLPASSSLWVPIIDLYQIGNI